jgi:epoxyqueuosine reductase QueG
LEAGYYANEEIHPLQLTRQQSQPPRSSSRIGRPNTQEMDLETVQAQRQRATAKLHNLEQDIQRVISLRSENLKNEQLTSQYNTELSRYAREQNDWKLYERQLAGREGDLLEEARQQARQARSSGLGLAFWFGALLSGAGIYAFSQLMALQLDLRASFYLFLIALISGFVTIIITRID